MRDNILATLAYYDVFDFPLKTDEVFRYLIKLNSSLNQEEISLENIKKVLDQLVLDGRVSREGPPAGEAGDYYFIDDKSYLVPLRLKRQKISLKKWVKAKKAVHWLKIVPYVEAVFASGSLALNNCDELSDLDVLIVAKCGHIWSTRLLVSGLLSFLGMRRRYFEKIAPDKICLNHYITGQSLRIPFESIYNAQNYINLKPILVRDPGIIKRFADENNWINNFVIGKWIITTNENLLKIGFFSKLFFSIGIAIFNNKFGNWFENFARRYQTGKIVRNPLTKHTNGHVIYDDNQLAFHPDSPEATIMEKYTSKLKLLRSLTLF